MSRQSIRVPLSGKNKRRRIMTTYLGVAMFVAGFVTVFVCLVKAVMMDD